MEVVARVVREHVEVTSVAHPRRRRPQRTIQSDGWLGESLDQAWSVVRGVHHSRRHAPLHAPRELGIRRLRDGVVFCAPVWYRRTTDEERKGASIVLDVPPFVHTLHQNSDMKKLCATLLILFAPCMGAQTKSNPAID